MIHLGHAYQKSIAQLGTMQTILILLYRCIMLEYSDNYCMTSETFRLALEIKSMIMQTTKSTIFDYKTKSIRSTPNNINILKVIV